MAKPSDKSKVVNDFLKSLGMDRDASIPMDTCILCKESATDFRDDISRKEYTISGFCQVCQDKTFGV